MRAAPRRPASPPPQQIVIVPAPSVTRRFSDHPSVAEIQQALGSRNLRCFTRHDGCISAYCDGDGGGVSVHGENAEAVQLAKACGITLPDEALPLCGPVLFLGPPDSVRRHARKSKP
jgi:hypothetical protein